MEAWIQQVLGSDHAGITVLIAVFGMGLISVLSCACNFATIGVVAGYTGSIGSSGKSKAVVGSGIFFLAGTIISLTIIGGIIGYASETINEAFGNYWKIAVGLISIFFGLFTLDFLPFKIPSLNVRLNNHKDNLFSAIIFGLIVGGLSSACSLCCNPFFPIVLAASFVKGSLIWGILMLFSFSLGYGIPLAAGMIGIGLGLGKITTMIARFGTIIKYSGGIAMIITGFYFLLTV